MVPYLFYTMTINWLTFTILALATWRMASLLSNEDGPWQVFARLRKFGGEYWVPPDYKSRDATSWWGKGVICLYCVSVHVGFWWTIAYLLTPYAILVAFPFALSAIAIILDSIIERLN